MTAWVHLHYHLNRSNESPCLDYRTVANFSIIGDLLIGVPLLCFAPKCQRNCPKDPKSLYLHCQFFRSLSWPFVWYSRQPPPIQPLIILFTNQCLSPRTLHTPMEAKTRKSSCPCCPLPQWTYFPPSIEKQNSPSSCCHSVSSQIYFFC